ncbi:MAG: WYL domain-containing protein [Veillonella sp.]
MNVSTEIKGYQQQRTFNVSQYVKEHIYMFGGESITVTFKAKRSIVNQILDWFDGNVEFTNITADNVVCRVRVNHDAFKYWALQYMQSVKVLTPASLVTEVKAAIEEGLHQYS